MLENGIHDSANSKGRFNDIWNDFFDMKSFLISLDNNHVFLDDNRVWEATCRKFELALLRQNTFVLVYLLNEKLKIRIYKKFNNFYIWLRILGSEAQATL